MEVKETLAHTPAMLANAVAKFAARHEQRVAAGLSAAVPKKEDRKRRQPELSETSATKRSAISSRSQEHHEALPPNSAFLLDGRALCPLRDFLNSTECVHNLPMDSHAILRRCFW